MSMSPALWERMRPDVDRGAYVPLFEAREILEARLQESISLDWIVRRAAEGKLKLHGYLGDELVLEAVELADGEYNQSDVDVFEDAEEWYRNRYASGTPVLRKLTGFFPLHIGRDTLGTRRVRIDRLNSTPNADGIYFTYHPIEATANDSAYDANYLSEDIRVDWTRWQHVQPVQSEAQEAVLDEPWDMERTLVYRTIELAYDGLFIEEQEIERFLVSDRTGGRRIIKPLLPARKSAWHDTLTWAVREYERGFGYTPDWNELWPWLVKHLPKKITTLVVNGIPSNPDNLELALSGRRHALTRKSLKDRWRKTYFPNVDFYET